MKTNIFISSVVALLLYSSGSVDAKHQRQHQHLGLKNAVNSQILAKRGLLP